MMGFTLEFMGFLLKMLGFSTENAEFVCFLTRPSQSRPVELTIVASTHSAASTPIAETIATPWYPSASSGGAAGSCAYCKSTQE